MISSYSSYKLKCWTSYNFSNPVCSDIKTDKKIEAMDIKYLSQGKIRKARTEEVAIQNLLTELENKLFQ
jgi:hypothetical protein